MIFDIASIQYNYFRIVNYIQLEDQYHLEILYQSWCLCQIPPLIMLLSTLHLSYFNSYCKIEERRILINMCLRMVLTIVIAHTFCASRDTRVSYQ